VSGTGGIPPYSGNGIISLAGGTNNILLIDMNGCTANTTLLIPQPLALLSTISYTPIACYGNATNLAIGASGGTPPYIGTGNYNVSAGNYTYLITDSMGCTVTANANITQPNPLAIMMSMIPITCYNDSALVNIQATGGTPPYNGIGNFSLVAGNYLYTITDANACSTTKNFNLMQPLPLVATVNNILPSNCAGQNGSASISATGGSGNYLYSWTTGNYSSANPTNLAFGNHTVYIKDALNPNCMTSVSFSVGSLGNLALAEAIQNVSCNGFCDASIATFATGGSGNYSYFWSNGANIQNISSLCVGTYVLNVVDLNPPFCQVTKTYSISGPSAIQIDVLAQTNVNCFGTNNGNITVLASGSWGNYTYSWSNGQLGATLSNASANNYTVTVMDSLCTANQTITLSQPTPIFISAEIIDAACSNVQNGALNLSVIGGSSNTYTFSWNNGNMNDSLANLAVGEYIVWVTDSLNCTVADTFSISSSINLSANIEIITNPDCGIANGIAQANVLGGSGNYLYNWSNGQNTQTATHLADTTYFVIITDSSNSLCSINASVNLNNSTSPTNVAINPTNISSICEGQILPLYATATNANSFIWFWNNQIMGFGDTLSAIQAGSYQVVAYSGENGLGCSSASELIVLNLIEKAEAQLNFGNGSNICIHDSILLVASGGISYQWFQNFQPILNATQPTYYAISDGLYSVSVTNTCNSDTSDIKELQIQENTVRADFITIPDTVYAYQPIQFIDSSLNGYTWKWLFSDNSISNDQNPVHTYPVSGIYEVTLIVYDNYGCADTITQQINISEANAPFVPNIFTPNNDGLFDVLLIDYQDVVLKNFQVFDRWGYRIFATNKERVHWNGESERGGICPTGVYFYVLEGKNARGEEVIYKGNVTLMR
jgi:gliding motility-associated-like protein